MTIERVLLIIMTTMAFITFCGLAYVAVNINNIHIDANNIEYKWVCVYDNETHVCPSEGDFSLGQVKKIGFYFCPDCGHFHGYKVYWEDE